MYSKLPKDKKDLVRVLETHIDHAESRMSWRYVTWKLAYHYLCGARRFPVFDAESNVLEAFYLDEEGDMEFQSQELLSMIDRVSAQVASMDLRPKVLRKGMSLASIRDRALTQAIADAVTSPENIDRVKGIFSYYLCALGSAGIVGHVEDHPTIGLTTDYQVIHPRELYPFPMPGYDFTKTNGLVWRRWVPLSYLKDKFGAGTVSRAREEMTWYEDVPGKAVDVESGGSGETGEFVGDVNYSGDGGGHGTMKGDPFKTGMGMALVDEVWITGHRGLVERYIVRCGDKIFVDEDFEGLEVYMPIGYARFFENGTWHGAGMFDLLFGIHRQYEKMLKQLFNNVMEMDRYGVVVLPQGQFHERSMLREAGHGLRILSYEPDPIESNFRPFNISPFNSGDVPGKTAAYAQQIMQGLSPWQDLLQEKGRVDSQVGLSFLDEKIQHLMNTPTRNSEAAWGQAHRAMLASAASKIAEARRPIPVTQLTLEMAGAVVSEDGSKVSFEQNPMPDLSNVEISVREVVPRSEVARKQEAMQLVTLPGFEDPLKLIMLSLKEGLDFAYEMGTEQAAYETVILNILKLYGNGEEPGNFKYHDRLAFPPLQLAVLKEFMVGPMMAVASAEVQEHFLQYEDALKMAMEQMMPPQVPNLQEAALMAEQEAERQKEMTNG